MTATEDRAAVPTLGGRIWLQTDETIFRTFGSVAFTELSPDTAPDVIAAQHLAEVKLALRKHGPDVVKIGEALMLPAGIVRRHLIALGAVAELSPRDLVGVADAVARELASGPLTVGELTKRGYAQHTAAKILRTDPRFKRVGRKCSFGRPVSIWGLA